jgi:excisionase family DNA binding protein
VLPFALKSVATSSTFANANVIAGIVRRTLEVKKMVWSNPPLGLGIAEACAMLGIGRTTIYGLIKAGNLRAVKVGRRTIVLYADLQRYAETLPPIAPTS